MKPSILFILIFTTISITYSQFDKFVFQLGIGGVDPYENLKGTYYRIVYDRGIPLIAPDTNLYSTHYGAKPGLYFYGKAKVNFDKYNIFRAMIDLSYSTFNTFEPSRSGNIERVVHIDTTTYITPVSTTFNYTFNVFSIGLGFEVAPIAFTNVISPFIGGNISFNAFNSRLSRTENYTDSISFNINDYRIGFNIDLGIEAKFSKMVGAVIGYKYDFGNVWLKNNNSGIADAYDWGSSNAKLNDEGGPYFSSIQSPLISSDLYLLNGKQKKINWGTFYLGINIYFDTHTKTKPPNKK